MWDGYRTEAAVELYAGIKIEYTKRLLPKRKGQ